MPQDHLENDTSHAATPGKQNFRGNSLVAISRNEKIGERKHTCPFCSFLPDWKIVCVWDASFEYPRVMIYLICTIPKHVIIRRYNLNPCGADVETRTSSGQIILDSWVRIGFHMESNFNTRSMKCVGLLRSLNSTIKSVVRCECSAWTCARPNRCAMWFYISSHYL